MLEEETQHFPRRVRPSRIGVGANGTAARPRVAGTMNVPVFGDRPPAGVGKDGAGIGMAVGHPAAKHLRCRTRRFGELLENPVAVVGMHRGVAIAMENDRRYPFPCRIAANAEGRSLAAPQARPECMPTAAYRSTYVAPMMGTAAPPAARPATY